MNKKLIAAASVATLAAGGSAAAIASAADPYNPYNPYTTTTGTTTTTVPTTTTTVPTTTTTDIPPVLPSPAASANAALRATVGPFRRTKFATRTSVRFAIPKATPGTYTIRAYRQGTRLLLFHGSKTLTGTVSKTLVVTLRTTKAGRAYMRRVKSTGRKTLVASVVITFKSAATGESATRKRFVRIGL